MRKQIQNKTWETILEISFNPLMIGISIQFDKDYPFGPFATYIRFGLIFWVIRIDIFKDNDYSS